MDFNKIINPEEVRKYQEYYAKKHGVTPDDIEILKLNFVDDNEVEVDYRNLAEHKVERIRRITGEPNRINL